MKKLNPSDLPISSDGRIYHLNIYKDQLADNIILVGDPERADQVAYYFNGKDHYKTENREFITITGTFKKKLITVIGTGIGTDNIEIVLTEIDALKRFNLKTRRPNKKAPRLTIIRVVTSGALQKETKLGTLAITISAVGLDNTGLFYDVPFSTRFSNERELERIVNQKISSAISIKKRFYEKIHPYAADANFPVIDELVNSASKLNIEYKLGFTASAPGFFGCQGRDLGTVPLTVKNLDGALSEIEFNNFKFQNFEMEASFLLHYAKALGHRAGVICAMIANRRENTFDQYYQESVDNAIKVALNAIIKL